MRRALIAALLLLAAVTAQEEGDAVAAAAEADAAIAGAAAAAAARASAPRMSSDAALMRRVRRAQRMHAAQGADPALLAPAGADADGPAAVATAAVAASFNFTIRRPVLRQQWYSLLGFCGETSVQMLALQHGVWVSQRQARFYGAPNNGSRDLWLEDRGSKTGTFQLLKMLSFNQPGASMWDWSNQSVTTTTSTVNGVPLGVTKPTATDFMTWVKRQILAGSTGVITGVRLKGSTDPYWDHIVPIYGVGTSVGANTSTPSDVFISGDDSANKEFNRTLPSVLAPFGVCNATANAGCVPSDAVNAGVSVTGLADTAKIFMPTVLTITGWSDTTKATSEAGESSAATTVTAKYRATISGLVPGVNYTTYRMAGLWPKPYTLPTTAAAMASACTARGTGCAAKRFVAPASVVAWNETSGLGTFVANSIQFFLTVKV